MIQAWVLGSDKGSISVNQRTAFKYRKYGIDRGQEEPLRASKPRQAQHLRWARSIFLVFAFVLLFSGFAILRTFAFDGTPAPADQTEQIVSVDAGDTLWAIADRVKRDHLDTRDAVHAIMKRNGMSDAILISGQEIIIPSRVIGEQ